MKKLLALVLALVMTLGLATVGASAAYSDFTDTADVSFEEAMKVMNAVGVFVGDGNKLDPKGNLTRAQAAKLVAYLALGEDIAEALPKTGSKFTDAPDGAWFTGYVNYMANEGYTSGTSATTFSPNGELNGYQFGAFLLAVLGYDRELEGMVGNGWETKVAVKLEECGITDGVDKLGSAALTREEAAQFCLNALKADTVKYADKGTSIDINGAKITTGAKSAEAVTDANATGRHAINGTGNIIQLGEKLYKGDLKFDYGNATADDMGRTAIQWSYKGKNVVKHTAEADSTFVVSSTSGNLNTLVGQLYNQNKNYKTGNAFDSTNNVAVDPSVSTVVTTNFAAAASNAKAALYVNGKTTTDYAPAKGDVVEVFTVDGYSNLISRVVVYRYSLLKITKVDTNVSTADKNDDVTAYVSLKNGTTTKIYKDTDIADFDAATYVKDAYIAAVISEKAATTAVLKSAVVTPASQGKVTAYKGTNGADAVTVDGTRYANYAAKVTGYWKYVDTDKDGIYAVYNDPNGYVIGVEQVEEGKTVTDARFVVAFYNATNANGSYGEKTSNVYAQLVDSDGKLENVVIGRAKSDGTILGAAIKADGIAVLVGSKATSYSSGDYFYVKDDGTIGIANTTDTSAPTAGDALITTSTPFYRVAASATYTKNHLYTVGSENSDKYCALTAYTGTGSNTKAEVADINSEDITKSRTKVDEYYITDNTRFIVTAKTLSDAKVTVLNGKSNIKLTTPAVSSDASGIIGTKAGSSWEAAYVFIALDSSYTSGAVTDVLYVKSVGDKNTDGKVALTVINDKGEEETITAEAGPAKNKFYTYSTTTNDKGETIYTLTLVDSILGNAAVDGLQSLYKNYNHTSRTWAGAYKLGGTATNGLFNTDNLVTVLFDHLYGTKATLRQIVNDQSTPDFASTQNFTITDIEAKDAVVIDVHEKDDDAYHYNKDSKSYNNNTGRTTYSGTVSTLEELGELADDYVIAVDVSVDANDGVKLIVVRDIYVNTGAIVALDAEKDDAALKALDDGAYAPKSDSTTFTLPGGHTAATVRVFKFHDANNSETTKYTLNIKNGNGAIVYTETASFNNTNGHYFYIDYAAGSGMATDNYNTGVWSQGGDRLPAGNYTWEISAPSRVIVGGAFTLE